MVNKIVIFIRTFSQYGGVENFCYRFFNYLLKNGYDVKIVCGENKTNIKDESIIVLGLWRPGRFLKTLSFYIKSIKYLKKIKEKNTTIVAFGKVAGCDFYRTGSSSHLDFMIKSMKGYKGLSFLTKMLKRLLNPINYYDIYIERKIFKNKSTRFIAISNMVKNELINRFKIEENKITIINNSVNKDIFNKANILKLRKNKRSSLNLNNKKVIGFCSTNFELKGLSFLIKSLQYLPEDYVILVAGGRNPKKYIKLAKSINVEYRVHFLGKVKDMLAFYAMLDVFCHPSFYDTFGSVVAEAISCNIPVVTSKSVGAKDLIINGINGYVLEEINEELIAKYIQKCVELKSENFVDTALDDDKVFNNYLNIIKELA
ncbi:glycosyltransferase family 4 protein [Deferribacteraceae bacterium V6Fe1]|nr:glycosyltransferase family 4 protein [Deferribacteraceae bacterium V6Fe1]